MTLTAPETPLPRDRYQRPLVVPKGGGKPEAYTRCTTFVSCLEDTYNLSKWQQRMVALGLAQSPDLMLGVNATDPTDKRALDKFCEQAMERAKANAAATTGTALHALTERIDRGQEVGVVPDAYIADLAAYTEATKHLTSTHIEQFCVLDTLKIGGTPDRVVKYQGKSYIADLKTGSITFGILKIAMQLAVYARSETYNHVTHERGHHDADLTKALIIHLPAGQGTCELVWVDIVAGWHAVNVARQVREKRSLSFKDLTTPYGEVDTTPTVIEPLTLEQQITRCVTPEDVRALWNDDWTPDQIALAKNHVSKLQVAS